MSQNVSYSDTISYLLGGTSKWSIVRFLAGPVKSICQLPSIIFYCTRGRGIKKTSASEMRQHIPQEGRIPAQIAVKIEQFIRGTGLDPNTVVLIQQSGNSTAFGCSPMAAFYSYPAHGFGLIAIHPNVVKEIGSNFTLAHRFMLMHEGGHINSPITAQTIDGASSFVHLTAYIVTVVAFQTLLPTGWVVMHLSACSVARIGEELVKRKITRESELAADRFAAKHFPQSIEGAEQIFKKMRDEALAEKAEGLATLQQLKQRASCWQRAILWLFARHAQWFIKETGDRTALDPYHPRFAERIQAMKSVRN